MNLYEEQVLKVDSGLFLFGLVVVVHFVSKYGLEDNTVDFIGHALALHRDDRYLDEPALGTVKRMKVEFDVEGKVCGVTSEGETAKCKKVVRDPSYLPNKPQVRKVGKVARAITIMSHPIPNTDDSHSVQVILRQKQLGRKSDMYLFCCSYSHNVAPKGKFIAFVSSEAETDRPEIELKPGIDLLGPVDELFFDSYSYDAMTHFESTVMDVLHMYRMITRKDLPVLPAHPTPDQRATHEKWLDDDNKARCYVLVSMSNELQRQYEDMKTARSILYELHVDVSVNIIEQDVNAIGAKRPRDDINLKYM
uniref:Guanosine nucleotide diphosphate dissociation inhibitor 2 n=1 Tax=Elaeis guineensis var. tenera TaxID=51953 RepID=A0A8N4F6N2_ELAGV|nr:guanosine nucleotide diphosphate dissociation inhibitor 2 [Elaeis guineensis]